MKIQSPFVPINYNDILLPTRETEKKDKKFNTI